MKIIYQWLISASFGSLLEFIHPQAGCEEASCGPNAICNEISSWYGTSNDICSCEKGFMSTLGYFTFNDEQSLNCVDINECDLDVCHTTQTCINFEGSYECECNDGFIQNTNLVTFQRSPCVSLHASRVYQTDFPDVLPRYRREEEGSGDEEITDIVVAVEAEVITSIPWEADLADTTSEVFKENAEIMETAVTNSFSYSHGSTVVECTGFSQTAALRKRSTTGTTAEMSITITLDAEDIQAINNDNSTAVGGDDAFVSNLAESLEETVSEQITTASENSTLLGGVGEISSTSEVTTEVQDDPEFCENIFLNQDVWENSGVFYRRGPEWNSYHKYNELDATWKVKVGSQFYYQCHHVGWKDTDIAFKCTDTGKIKFCDDQNCNDVTEKELTYEMASYIFKCSSDCINIWSEYPSVFAKSERWEMKQKGWKNFWKFDWEAWKSRPGIPVGTAVTHKCKNKKNKTAFICDTIFDKTNLYMCYDTECDMVNYKKTLKPRYMTRRFNC